MLVSRVGVSVPCVRSRIGTHAMSTQEDPVDRVTEAGVSVRRLQGLGTNGQTWRAGGGHGHSCQGQRAGERGDTKGERQWL